MAKSNKGGAFEREIAKHLSLWWSNGENDNLFWRTSNSGGRATVRKKKGKETKYDVSDLKAIDPDGQPLMDFFSMELKTGYREAILQDLFHHVDNKPDKKRDCWWNWIKQAKHAWKNSGSFTWCLIVKRPSRKPLFMTPVIPMFTSGIFDMAISIEKMLVMDLGFSSELLVCELDDFLDAVPPKKINEWLVACIES